MDKSKIIIAQFYTSNVEYGPYAEAINKKYCEEKGYTYFCEKDTDKIIQKLKGRSATWYKPILIKEIISTYNPEYILFLDIDAIVSDFNQNIEDFIDEKYDLTFTKDIGHHSILNAGVFVLKNTEWVKDFLDLWYYSAEIYKGKDCPEIDKPEERDEIVGYYKTALWHDQTCLTLLYKSNKDIQNHIQIIESNQINHYKPNEGNFIFHAYAYGHVPFRGIDVIHNEVFNRELIPQPEKEITNNITLIDLVTQNNYNTDKHHGHGYFKLIYNDLLSPLSKDVKKFVEIGVNAGGSVELWRDYFREATVYGLDINVDIALNGNERIELKRVDQSKREELIAFGLEHNDIDVLVEDGSHKMYDQQITLATLFKSIKPGGIYILEDLHTSLEAPMPEKAWCGWGDPNKTITLNMLNNFIKTGKIESDYLTDDEKEYLNNNIESIEIYRSKPDWSITSVIKKKQLIVDQSIIEEEIVSIPVIEESKSFPKIAIVYHCYLINDWKEIVTNQLARVKESGLYDATDLFFTTVNCNEDQQNEFKDLLKDYNKIQIEFAQNKHYEYPGIKKVKDLGTEYNDLKILYFHAKGVSNKYKKRDESEISEEKIKNIKAWKECLEYFVIDKWKESVEKLDSFDNVGVTCNANWFWGNFWWTQSKHVKKTIDVTFETRWFYESWLNYAVADYTAFEWYKFLYNPYISFIDSNFYTRPDLASLKIVLHKASYGFSNFEIDEGFHQYPLSEKEDVTEIFKKYLETKNNNDLQISVNSDFLKSDPIPEYPKKFLFLEFSLEGYPEKIYNVAYPTHTFLNFKLF
jgi:hypothetical protein